MRPGIDLAETEVSSESPARLPISINLLDVLQRRFSRSVIGAIRNDCTIRRCHALSYVNDGDSPRHLASALARVTAKTIPGLPLAGGFSIPRSQTARACFRGPRAGEARVTSPRDDFVPFVQHPAETFFGKPVDRRLYVAWAERFGNVEIATEGGTQGRPVRWFAKVSAARGQARA